MAWNNKNSLKNPFLTKSMGFIFSEVSDFRMLKISMSAFRKSTPCFRLTQDGRLDPSGGEDHYHQMFPASFQSAFIISDHGHLLQQPSGRSSMHHGAHHHHIYRGIVGKTTVSVKCGDITKEQVTWVYKLIFYAGVHVTCSLWIVIHVIVSIDCVYTCIYYGCIPPPINLQGDL